MNADERLSDRGRMPHVLYLLAEARVLGEKSLLGTFGKFLTFS